jgi:hypothetical protein
MGVKMKSEDWLIIILFFMFLYCFYYVLIKPDLKSVEEFERNSQEWNNYVAEQFKISEQGGDPDSVPKPKCPSPWEGL